MVLTAAAVHADPPELVTDRPDQTESAETVPRGTTQVEIGWTRTRDKEAGTRVETEEVPGTLVRIGLADGVELRLGWSGQLSEEIKGVQAPAEQTRSSGRGDAEIGAKFVLARQRPGRPQVALLASTSVPVGEARFSSDRFDPSLRLLLAHDLRVGAGLGYNVGVQWVSEPSPRGGFTTRPNFVYTAAVGLPLGDRLGAFAEIFGELPDIGGDSHSFAAGLTFLLSPRLQLDVSGGVGLNDAAPDSFLGVGLSFRIPG